MMPIPRFLDGRRLLISLAWALGSPAHAADAPPQGPVPCRIPGVAHELRCGSVQRPLDSTQAPGRHITVHYAVLPAIARQKQADPVFMLAGGPGQSAVDLIPHVQGLFQRLNQRRDIVFVDQRGTGRSAPLLCEPERGQSLLTAWARGSDNTQTVSDTLTCLKTLGTLPWVQQTADLVHFNTPEAMRDIEAVRQQLGAPQINLVAASYGTRAALDYLRQFPAQVRRMVLDGVVPPDMGLHLSSSGDAQAALEAVLSACAAETACTQRHGDLRQAWHTLLAQLPQTVALADPRSGQTQTITVTREMVLAAVRAPLYSPALAAGLPTAIHAGAQGRFEPLAGLFSALSSQRSPKLFMGMHFSVVCSEDVLRPQRPADAAGRDFGDAAAQRYQAVCAQWPSRPLPEAFYQVPTSPAPVLLLSGGADPVTPPRHGARMAQALGDQAVHVVVPQAGHGVMSLPCTPDLVFRFINAADPTAARQVDARCAQNVPRPLSFAPIDPTAPDGLNRP